MKWVFVLMLVAVATASVTHRTMPEDWSPDQPVRVRSDTHSPREIKLRAESRTAGQGYSLCSFPRRHLLAVSDVIIEPQTVKVGDTVKVTVLGSLSKQVDNGTTDLSISYGFIQLKEEKSSVCEMMQCPVPEGAFEYSQEFPIGAGTPNGKFTISFEVMASEHERVMCVEFDVHVRS